MYYYNLQTNLKITPAALEGLRRKIAPIQGKHDNIWHNHSLEDGKTIHRYPSVQYKIWQNRFAIIALPYAEATLFELIKKMPLQIKGWPPVDMVKLEKFPLHISLSSKIHYYHCNNWLPMDSEYYQLYLDICAELGEAPSKSKIQHPTLLAFFAGILKEQILKNAYSLGVLIEPSLLEIGLSDQPLRHSLVKINGQRWSKIGKVQLATNLHWPLHLGIGKRTAIGFGMLRKQ